jgi:hypothetical protein
LPKDFPGFRCGDWTPIEGVVGEGFVYQLSKFLSGPTAFGKEVFQRCIFDVDWKAAFSSPAQYGGTVSIESVDLGCLSRLHLSYSLQQLFSDVALHIASAELFFGHSRHRWSPTLNISV